MQIYLKKLIIGMIMFRKFLTSAICISGIIVVPAGLIGAVGGGLLIERLKLPYTRIVQTQLLTSILTIFALGSLVIHCEQTLFAGVNSEYPSNGLVLGAIMPIVEDGSAIILNTSSSCSCLPAIQNPTDRAL